jgi:hypothetical protein
VTELPVVVPKEVLEAIDDMLGHRNISRFLKQFPPPFDTRVTEDYRLKEL